MWDTATSWSKYISFYLAEKEKYYVVPYCSLSTCFSDKGQHTGFESDQCQVTLSQSQTDCFNFLNINDCAVYDSFFERRDCFIQSIGGIDFKNICMDLNGMKYDFSGYEAVLTTKVLDYEVICSFGINMDPIEINVKYQVPGKVLKLYRLPKNNQINMFEAISVPTTSIDRLYHQLGKFRRKNIMTLFIK